METSSSAQTEKKGIGKLVSKFKAVFRKISTSRTAGDSSQIPATAQSSAPATQQKPVVQADTSQEDPEAKMQEPHAMQVPAESHAVIEVDTFDIYDRSQILLAKFNLDIVRPIWPAQNIPPLERVSKPIRMRVRYTCHRCNMSFGHDKECNGCRHRRCARCDRYPPRKSKPAPERTAPVSALTAGVQEAAPEKSEPIPADHVCICHECQTAIEIEVRECPNCHHIICERCHKEAHPQNDDAQNAEIISTAGKEERKAQPEEQKLPPDKGTAHEQLPTESR